MTKRLMILFVFSSVLSSGVNAAGSLQDIASRAANNLYQAFTRVRDGAYNIVAGGADDATENLFQQNVLNGINWAFDNDGSRLDLYFCNRNGLHAMSLAASNKVGNGSEVPTLVLEGVKELSSVITQEQAAVMYVATYIEIADNALKALPEILKKRVSPINDASVQLEQILQVVLDIMSAIVVESAMKEQKLALALAEYVLPEDVKQECETAMWEFNLKYIGHVGEMFTNTPQVRNLLGSTGAIAKFVSGFYLEGLLEILVTILEQHYTIDRAALGLEPKMLLESESACDESKCCPLALEANPEDVD